MRKTLSQRAPLPGVLLVLCAGALAMGCIGGADAPPDQQGAGEPASANTVRAPDGSLRRPFLGGAFVTYNQEMPVDIDQAIAGEPTDHPVVVWAGP